MKFKPATQPRGFQPIQLSRAGIQELRIRDNRIINNMQNIFNAEKDQQDRDRAAMQENAKLELDRIQRDRAIEVDNLKNEELAISQQAKVDIQQDKFDAEAANTFFDSIADFSKTAIAKAAENHANMIRDQEEAGRTADITKERQEARKAYETLSKGAIKSDTDALEYASETGEPFLKTLQAIVGNAGRGAVQDRIIVNRLYQEIFDTEITKASKGTERIYTDAAGNKFSGVEAAADPDKARIMTDTVRSGVAKNLGVSTAREGYLDPANEAITKRSDAIAERAVNIGIGQQREIAKAQAETLNGSGTAEGMIHAWNLTSNSSAGGKAQAWSDLRTLIDNPQTSLDEINKAAAAIDGIDPKVYDITSQTHRDGSVNKRYPQIQPHLTKRLNNERQIYDANRRLRDAQVREQTYAMTDQIEAAVRANPVAAERELTKVFNDAGMPMPTLAKNIINNATEELEREETERLNFISRHGAITEAVINSIKHPTVRKAAIELYKKQEEERYGPDAALIKKGFATTARLKTGMNPNEKGMGSQALLYQAKMETEYTRLLEETKDPRVAYEKLNKLIDDATDPNVSLDNPFRKETRANNRLYFPNIEGTADRVTMRQTLDHALKTYGADLSKYAYNVETEEQTQLTLITARRGKPVFSPNLISAVDYINKSNPNKKPLLYSEFFNAMQKQKTLQSGQYHGFIGDSLGAQAMDAMPPEVAKMIADAEHFMSNRLAQRATITATGGLPLHLRRSMGGGEMQELRNLVLSGEGGFTSANRGIAGDTRGGIPGLDKMTVADWKNLYRQGWNALGGPQFIEDTFIGAVNRLNLSDNTVMTGQVQLQLFDELILGGVKRPRLSAYLNGTSDDLNAALEDISLEFASVANPNTGITSYPNVGDNAASITSNEMAEVLQRLRATRLSSQTPQTLQTQEYQRPENFTLENASDLLELQNKAYTLRKSPGSGLHQTLAGPAFPDGSPHHYVFGDSLAVGHHRTRYRNNPKGTNNSDAQVSRSPQKVLAHLRKYKGHLNKAEIDLSTGALNNQTDWVNDTIAMFEFLISERVAKVNIIGFPNTPKFATMRAKLDDLARLHGFNPPVHYTPGPDGIHPAKYRFGKAFLSN